MQDVIFWVVSLILLGLLAVLVPAILRAADNLPDPLDGIRAFVRKWDAQLVAGKLSLVDPSQYNFVLIEREATLEFSSPGDDAAPTYTHLTLPLTGIHLRLELRPQWLHGAWVKLLGMDDIEIGVLHFDEAFTIQGSGPREVREFLTPDVQSAILRLARCTQYGTFDLHLQISGGSLRVTKHARLTSERDLSNLVSCTLDLLQVIQELDTGIEFSPTRTLQSAETTQCQVCGDPLQEKIVYCTRCQTPHHHDCWQYFGSCSVYGCGQKRFADKP